MHSQILCHGKHRLPAVGTWLISLCAHSNLPARAHYEVGISLSKHTLCMLSVFCFLMLLFFSCSNCRLLNSIDHCNVRCMYLIFIYTIVPWASTHSQVSTLVPISRGQCRSFYTNVWKLCSG